MVSRQEEKLEWIELRIFTARREEIIRNVKPLIEKLDREAKLKHIHILREDPWAPVLLRLSCKKKEEIEKGLEHVFEPLKEKGVIDRIEKPYPAYSNREEESKLIQGLRNPKLSPVELIDIGSRWGLLFRNMTNERFKAGEKLELHEMMLLLHYVLNNLGFSYGEEIDIHEKAIRQIHRTIGSS